MPNSEKVTGEISPEKIIAWLAAEATTLEEIRQVLIEGLKPRKEATHIKMGMLTVVELEIQ